MTEEEHENLLDELYCEIAIEIGSQYIISWCLPKTPCRTSTLSGQQWVKELLEGSPTRFLQQCRMTIPVFNKLCSQCRNENLLKNTKNVTVEEQVIIFLHIVSQNQSNRAAQERFQHSGETIHRHLHSVFHAFLMLSKLFITLPPNNADFIPEEISCDGRFSPYFDDCIGAIDGSHIPATPPTGLESNCRNRKGFFSQNVMAACHFNCTFSYILSGWEGSAPDGRVLADALTKGFEVPPQKYYLVDAGYGNEERFIAPYRGVRYHLREWEASAQRYAYDHSYLPLMSFFAI